MERWTIKAAPGGGVPRESIIDDEAPAYGSQFQQVDRVPSEPLREEPTARPYSREDEGTGGWLARQATRSAAQAGSSIAGLPGNVEDIFSSLFEAASGYTPTEAQEKTFGDTRPVLFTPDERQRLGQLGEHGVDPEASPEQRQYDEMLMKSQEAFPEQDPGKKVTLPTSTDIFSKVKEYFPEGYLDANNWTEKLADRVSSVAPVLAHSLFAGGFKLVAAIPEIFGALATAGSEQVVEELGGGPLAQALTGLVVGGGLSMLKKAKTPRKGLAALKPDAEAPLMTAIKNERKAAYAVVDKRAPDMRVPITEDFKEQIVKFGKEKLSHKSGLQTPNLREVTTQLGPLSDQILHAKGFLPGDFFTDGVRQVNKLIKDTPASKGSIGSYKYFAGLLRDHGISALYEQDPKVFGNNYVKGGLLTKAIHGVDEIGKFTSGIIDDLPMISGPVKKFLKRSGWFLNAKNAPLMVKFIDAAPGPAMKYLGKALLSASQKDKVNLVRSIVNLDKVLQDGKRKKARKSQGNMWSFRAG